MPRSDQRRATLLVVLVAVLGLLGVVVVADGSASRGVHVAADAPGIADGAPGIADGAPGVAEGAALGAEGTVATAAATVGPHATVEPEAADGPGRSLAHRGERAVVVRLAADHLRPVVPTAPALTVLASVLVVALAGRSFVAAVVAAVARRSPLSHLRRRGPPALAVV